MRRSLMLASAFLASALLMPAAQADNRTLPMRFDLRQQGPAIKCGDKCATWIVASGAITADSARDFTQFMQNVEQGGQKLRAATVVLDSDGGSVHGAIALGREIRKLALATTVGRVVDVDSKDGKGSSRAVLSPRADCESMCAFVLLGGVERTVPTEARVMVHQIWLGDRREDPTAATYSAEDLVLVQRDIGKLAQYTADMGGSIGLLDLALRIPPWEPLHVMSAEEIHRTRLATVDDENPEAATVAASPPSAAPPPPLTDGVRTMPISEKRWAVVEHEGIATLARRHPLTIEGEPIGSFDLAVSCGGSGSFDLRYIERRRRGDRTPLPAKLSGVSLRVGPTVVVLKLASSVRGEDGGELVSYAAGVAPAAMIDAFASPGNHSMTISTRSDKAVTVIRLGNTGARQNLPRLVSSCRNKPLGARAEAATIHKTGGMAIAR